MKVTIFSRLLCITLLSALASCSEPTIDASSRKAMQKSESYVRSRLSSEKEEEFKSAVGEISKSVATSKGPFAMVFNEADVWETVMAKLDGKTAQQIIDQAQDIRVAQREQERIKAIAEVIKLEKRKEAHDKDKQLLTSLKVLEATITNRKKNPVIKLKVRNDTEFALSRVYFDGQLISPGRTIPYLEKTLSHAPSGE